MGTTKVSAAGFEARIDGLGRVLIPPEVRAALGLQAGDPVWGKVVDACLILYPVDAGPSPGVLTPAALAPPAARSEPGRSGHRPRGWKDG